MYPDPSRLRIRRGNQKAVSAITLRNIPPELRKRLEKEAAETGASLNKTAIRLLLRATGLAGHSAGEHRFRDLDHLAGAWSEEEVREFDEALAEQRQIDKELWD